MQLNQSGPQTLVTYIQFNDWPSAGIALHPTKVAMFPQNFREIAGLLPRDNQRASDCANWLTALAAEYENPVA
jgi:hypothetical protein